MGSRLKIEAHDASRIEWLVYVPLPLSGGRDGEAEVELTLEIPENVYAPHECWEQLQILARLSSPDEDALLAEATPEAEAPAPACPSSRGNEPTARPNPRDMGGR